MQYLVGTATTSNQGVILSHLLLVHTSLGTAHIYGESTNVMTDQFKRSRERNGSNTKLGTQ